MTERPSYERRLAAVMAALPYGLLAISVALSLAVPGPSPNHRLVTIGLAAVAAGWILAMYTWMDSRWTRPLAGRLVYIAGLLLISGVLVAHSGYFIAFAVTCFVQALMLLPTLPALVGVALASVVVFLVPIGFRIQSVEDAINYGLTIALETFIVGGLSVMALRARDGQVKLIAELRRALDENAGLQDQLLTQAREAGKLDERGRIAREIHDTLAQGLAGIITQLEAAQQAGDRSPHVAQASAVARESLAEARRSVQALRPAPLEAARLPDAIGDMAHLWSETTAVPLTFQATGEPKLLPAELEVTLFRAAQEALANVAKHARATKVGLTLSFMDDVVLLDVRDDGIGFDPARVNGNVDTDGGLRFGLRAMGERLRQVGGELEVESAPGAGTAINARVPVASAERER